MRSERKAVVVGGGIGGLAAALGLWRAGWDVEVLERAPVFGEVGAGLSLWPNALRALDALGVADEVRGRSQLHGQAGIRDARGRWLTRTDNEAIRSRYGDVAMIHRADFIEVLRAALPGTTLRPGITVDGVQEDGTVAHSDGTSQGDVVVGADGIDSTVRRSLWEPVSPRYAGYTAWRWVTPPMDVRDSSETWGRGRRFGYAPLADGRVYCFAVANAPEGAPDEGVPGLKRRFSGWHAPIDDLLEAAGDATLLHHDLFDLPDLDSFVRGSVVLLGDAAHAMTPNLGQGACQALEDAVVLADIASRPDLSLPEYDALRRPRTQMVVARSRRIGAAAQASSRPVVALRDLAVRAMPQKAFTRSLDPVLTWSP
ncbi:MAG TPA: FAD-dependent monooxygenase [Nocardioides sp.]|nr:FAD-dependent monooxygenase [Nocardioides sp.]